MVIVGTIDGGKLYISNLGSWTPKFDRPVASGQYICVRIGCKRLTTLAAKFSFRVGRPPQADLQQSWDTGIANLQIIQRRGSDAHCKETNPFVGSDEEDGMIRVSAPLFEPRVSLQASMDVRT